MCLILALPSGTTGAKDEKAIYRLCISQQHPSQQVLNFRTLNAGGPAFGAFLVSKIGTCVLCEISRLLSQPEPPNQRLC